MMGPWSRRAVFLLLAITALPACKEEERSGGGPPATAGSLDSAFGASGIVLANLGAGDDVAHAVRIQPDGKIVTAGTDFSLGAFRVARFNADGSLDAAFGAGGSVATLINGNASLAYAMALQADGRIVVAGSTSIAPASAFAVVRYNPDGSLDSGFGSGGAVVTPLLNVPASLKAVAVQADGKIVAAGTYGGVGNGDIGVVRYASDGSLDPTFDGDGIALIAASPGGDDTAEGIALQPDGKIVIAGSVTVGTRNFLILRLNADGSLDTGFNGSGILNFAVGVTVDDGASAVRIQPDGKILSAGWVRHFDGTRSDIALFRCTASGVADGGFGAGGVVVTPIGFLEEAAHASVLQPDGRIVAGGYWNNGAKWDWALVRYHADGSVDSGFGASGIGIYSLGVGFETCNSLEIQPDGNLVGAGYAFNGTGNETALIRVRP